MTVRSSDVASSVSIVVQYLVVIVVGSIVLPFLFGSDAQLTALISTGLRSVLWVVIALSLVPWIAYLSTLAVPRVTKLINRLPRPPAGERAASPGVLALFLVASIDLIVLNAALRQPLSGVLALRWPLITADGSVGAIAAVLLLALLVRLHFIARPYVEGSAWSALDVIVATTSSDGLATTVADHSTTRAAATAIHATAPATTPRTIDGSSEVEATRREISDDATLRAARGND